MKLIKKYKFSLLTLLVLTFLSCAHEDLPKESELDYSIPVKSELDKWITTNYLDPYNINVQYKWNQYVVDGNRFLYPPIVDKVQPVLNIVKRIWLDSYTTIGGKNFVRIIAPREIVLVGGINLNTTGTVTLGLAEGGQRITLFETDLINRKSREDVKRFIHTIQHEYVHILNQNKAFDKEAWAKITPIGYTSNWHLETTPNSNELGFITAYSRSNVVEDFAETASIILINTKEDYAAILAGIKSQTAKDAIAKKEAIVVKYYKDAFGIDFYALRDEAQKNTIDVISN